MSEINGFGDEENYGEVFPSWYLVRLTNKVTKTPYKVNGHEMKEGSWGLTYCNDPDFVLDLDPMPDFPDDIPEVPKGYWKMLRHYSSRLRADVYPSYKLVKAVVESGWKEEEGGLTCYITNRIYEFLEECNWTPKRILLNVNT